MGEIIQMFRIDGKITDELLRQFASQVNDISPEIIKLFESLFSGREQKSYYEGLLAGYVNSYSLLSRQDTSLQQLAAIVAFVASKIQS